MTTATARHWFHLGSEMLLIAACFLSTVTVISVKVNKQADILEGLENLRR